MMKSNLGLGTLLIFILVGLPPSVSSTVYHGNDLNDGLNNSTFDYIVVGCGIAGLVTSARLTEDNGISVLCLEAGQLDHYEPIIQFPVYIGQQPPLFYEWGASTTPQTQLDGGTRSVPMGKGVGGGSLVNGMIWNRGSKSDFDSWALLTEDDGWSWSGMLPYFKKSEKFTPKWYTDLNDTSTGGLESFNLSVHGLEGPVQVSYPNYLWPQSDLWFEALQELGVPKCVDPNDGSSAGGYFIPLDIDAVNQTRSDARRAYYDPNCARPNYNLAIGAQVTRILFDSNDQSLDGNWTGPICLAKKQNPDQPVRASGVEFASDPSSPRQTIYASHSVILSAGAIHTSALLELSGIGDASIISPLNIPVIIDNPGVGNNLQDHAMIHLDYHYANTSIHTPDELLTNSTLNSLAEQQYVSSKTGPWTAKPSTAVAFPSLQQITNSTDIFSLLGLASLVNSTHYLPSSYTNAHPNLLTGYLTQTNQTLHALSQPTVPSHEILNSNGGRLDLSLMRPLSRGSSHIVSSNPFTLPAIDPNWLSHPLDLAIMERALTFNQRLLTTSALAQLQPTFNNVPFDPTPEQVEQILKKGVGTEYHYSGTAAMMPWEEGGVVDPRSLTVYGTRNLKVVDSSVFPLVPGGHLQAVVYAVAERGADLIRAERRREEMGEEGMGVLLK